MRAAARRVDHDRLRSRFAERPGESTSALEAFLAATGMQVEGAAAALAARGDDLAPLGREHPGSRRVDAPEEDALHAAGQEPDSRTALADGRRQLERYLTVPPARSELDERREAPRHGQPPAERCEPERRSQPARVGEDGEHERARRLARTFREAGAEAIVVNAAGCGSHLKDAELDLPVKDVSEVLAELPPRAERRALELSVAFQDSCHLAHAQGIRDEPRALLRAIPGVQLVEPAEQAICCGSAGIYNLVQPEPARELGERKAANVLATGSDVYSGANPGCLVQVSTYLRRASRPLPALHPIELLDASIRGVGRDELLASARR